MNPTEHFGVYAIWQQEGRLVLVRKTRGPYDGLLDLPGGSPEPGESHLDTLRRELPEECGVELSRVLESVTFEFHVSRDSCGRPIDFTHTGVISRVEVAGPVVHDIVAEDVRGVVLATATDAPRRDPASLTRPLLPCSTTDATDRSSHETTHQRTSDQATNAGFSPLVLEALRRFPSPDSKPA
jgi:8-oxo-dGTP pyrophosphatase MutT (NUDIX family)